MKSLTNVFPRERETEEEKGERKLRSKRESEKNKQIERCTHTNRDNERGRA